MKKYLLISILLFFVSNCYYTFYSKRFPEIETVVIEKFDIGAKDLEFNLSEDLYNVLNDKLIDSNVFDVVITDGDAIIRGEFTDYTKSISAAEENINEIDYSVSIVLSYEFYSLKDDKKLISESNYRETVTYSSESTQSINTEDEAITKILENIANRIVLKITESW